MVRNSRKRLQTIEIPDGHTDTARRVEARRHGPLVAVELVDFVRCAGWQRKNTRIELGDRNVNAKRCETRHVLFLGSVVPSLTNNEMRLDTNTVNLDASSLKTLNQRNRGV